MGITGTVRLAHRLEKNQEKLAEYHKRRRAYYKRRARGKRNPDSESCFLGF